MENKEWKFTTCLFLYFLMFFHATSGVVIRQMTEEVKDRVETGKTFKNSDLHSIPATVIDGINIEEIHKANYSKIVWIAKKDEYSSIDRSSRRRAFTSIFDNMDCFGCNAAVWSVQAIIDSIGKISDKLARKAVEESIREGCKKYLDISVCEGVLREFLPQIYFILKHTNLGAKDTCSFVMSGECPYVPSPFYEWEVTFPAVPKPPIVDPSPPREGMKKLKVLQLSDIHYDPYYQTGSNANCGLPLCCRLINGKPKTADDAAGKWGDYRKCDTPKRTLDHMFKHIKNIHPDIDYILWTGDLPPHDIWNQTREGNLQILRDIMEDMVKTFPNVTIFPALGNHESAPVNSFPTHVAPSEFSVSWLYGELDKQWRRWLPAGASNTVKRGAFYSMLVRPDFRIISINTNYCNDKNFWLLINSTDPVNELEWLIDELQGAENRSEKVHIIGHIPPGTSECLKVWSANYYRIINRYESTITAQFFGHTHFDEFELFYDIDNLTRPVSVAYVGPSVTTYDNLNPGYRIYYVDDDEVSPTRHVVDHETWIMNLQKANIRGFPTWRKSYSAKRAFGMSSLLPRDWDTLLDRMVENVNVFSNYYKYYYKNSHLRPRCDMECRRQLLCDIRSGRSRDRAVLCQKINEKLYRKKLPKSFEDDEAASDQNK